MQLFNGIYQLEERLDQGASAEVWKCTDTLTNTTLALKIYSPTSEAGTNGLQMLSHEFNIMVNANHRNLLKPLHFALCDDRPFLVLPYCQRGNISKLKGTFDEKKAWELLRDVAGGLAYLHDMHPPRIHQDIKPANILVADNGDFMLTDFGVSTYAKPRKMSNSMDKVLLSAGTLAYMPPEKFKSAYIPIILSDIWSLGSTVYEMLTTYLPFGNEGGMLQSADRVINPLPDTFSTLLNQTVLSCLSFNTWERPSAQDIYEQATEALKLIKQGKPLPQPKRAEPDPQTDPIQEPLPAHDSIPDPIEDSFSNTQSGKKGFKAIIYAIAGLVGLGIGILIALFL